MWPPVTRQDCSPTGRCSLAPRPLLGLSSSLMRHQWDPLWRGFPNSQTCPSLISISKDSPLHCHQTLEYSWWSGGIHCPHISGTVLCGASKPWASYSQRLHRWQTLESPSASKEIKPVNPKGDQPWIFIGRADAKLKLQYFGHLIRRTDSLEETPMLGRIKGRRRRGRQRMRWLDSTTGWMDMNLNKLWEIVKDREAWSAVVRRVTRSWTRLSNWTRTTSLNCIQTDPLATAHILYIKYRSRVTIAQLTFCRPFSHPYNILF